MASLARFVLLVMFLNYWNTAAGQVPGTCPTFPIPEECPPEPDDECQDDQACEQLNPGLGLKCCKDGCDRRCVPPIPPPTPSPQRDTAGQLRKATFVCCVCLTNLGHRERIYSTTYPCGSTSKFRGD